MNFLIKVILITQRRKTHKSTLEITTFSDTIRFYRTIADIVYSEKERLFFFNSSYNRDRDNPDIRQAECISLPVIEKRKLR